ncbi:MAG TPA: type II secretion system protein [Candidatus Saccharimonadales bacterium]
MSVKILHQLNRAGDTIVEVMVVLAILGLAISISYATANRSLLNARQAQENSEATELIQSQIEALRTLTSVTDVPNIFNPALQNYCLVPTGVAPNIKYTNASGASCNMGSVPYQINITYSTAPTDTFTVTATWPDVLGEGNDTVTTIYRLHQTP